MIFFLMPRVMYIANNFHDEFIKSSFFKMPFHNLLIENNKNIYIYIIMDFLNRNIRTIIDLSSAGR
jgi:hypothetical protein